MSSCWCSDMKPHTDSKVQTLLFLLWNTNWLMLTAVHSLYLMSETELRWNLLMFTCRERPCSASLTVGSCKLGASFLHSREFYRKAENIADTSEATALHWCRSSAEYVWGSVLVLSEEERLEEPFQMISFLTETHCGFFPPWYLYAPPTVVLPVSSSTSFPHMSSQFITATLLFVSSKIELII